MRDIERGGGREKERGRKRERERERETRRHTYLSYLPTQRETFSY